MDIAVIGAGPAGLTAAIFAAQGGAKVTVIESNAIAGKKLLLTGGGRCNLTHDGGVDHFVKAYGAFGRFLEHSLHTLSAAALRQFFAQHRLITKVHADGCVFPVTNRAADVGRVLVDTARRYGVRFVVSKRVDQIRAEDSGFVLRAGDEEVGCQSLVIATGGLSYPHTGCRGDGYAFAKGFGHTVAEPRAALTGLQVSQQWVKDLRGVALEDVAITAIAGENKYTSRGAAVFTDVGISGPAALDLSRLITDHLHGSNEPVDAFVDLLVDVGAQDLNRLLMEKCLETPRREMAGILTGMLPRILALAICGRLGPQRSIIASQLSRAKRQALVQLLKYMPVTVTGLRPLAQATVTRGGVCRDEIDSRTMQSRLHANLFFAGEVIDIDGPCGGYNLQIAWSTGALAGQEAARCVKGRTRIESIPANGRRSADYTAGKLTRE